MPRPGSTPTLRLKVQIERNAKPTLAVFATKLGWGWGFPGRGWLSWGERRDIGGRQGFDSCLSPIVILQRWKRPPPRLLPALLRWPLYSFRPSSIPPASVLPTWTKGRSVFSYSGL